jgi:hypothetical protein
LILHIPAGIKPGNSANKAVDFPAVTAGPNSTGKVSFFGKWLRQHDFGDMELLESHARYTKRRANRASIIPLVVRLFHNRPAQRPADL